MTTAFISSVIEGYSAYREAASEGIIDAGCRPLRIEDNPSLDATPRNACLNLVEVADVYVLLVAGRGGWVAPSGLSATHEEFRHARVLGKPTLVLLQDCERDSEAQRLADEVSDWVTGRYRVMFSDPGTLREQVKRGLAGVLAELERPMRDPREVSDAALDFGRDDSEAQLRISVAPERTGELFDPLRLDDPALADVVNRLGHDSEIGFFDYSRKKEVIAGRSLMAVAQVPERDPALLAEVHLRPDGLLLATTNVTGRHQRRGFSDMSGYLGIIESDVAAAAGRSLAMLDALFTRLDPQHRYDRLLVAVGLGGIGHRTWFAEPPTGGSMPMRMHGPDAVPAFDKPRSVSRAELSEVSNLRERIVALLRRELTHGHR